MKKNVLVILGIILLIVASFFVYNILSQQKSEWSKESLFSLGQENDETGVFKSSYYSVDIETPSTSGSSDMR